MRSDECGFILSDHTGAGQMFKVCTNKRPCLTLGHGIVEPCVHGAEDDETCGEPAQWGCANERRHEGAGDIFCLGHICETCSGCLKCCDCDGGL